MLNVCKDSDIVGFSLACGSPKAVVPFSSQTSLPSSPSLCMSSSDRATELSLRPASSAEARPKTPIAKQGLRPPANEEAPQEPLSPSSCFSVRGASTTQKLAGVSVPSGFAVKIFSFFFIYIYLHTDNYNGGKKQL